MTIKVIGGLKPWEVMKAVEEEGKQWAWRSGGLDSWKPDPCSGFDIMRNLAKFYGEGRDIAIIDDTKPNDTVIV